MEDNEIVYDDPGSVKDIRKKFGVRTNPEFAQPRGPILRYIYITFSYLFLPLFLHKHIIVYQINCAWRCRNQDGIHYLFDFG